jgi:1,4-alpha-glucan branching enzyme
VGRIARIKGQDIFLCAARQLLHAGEEAEFYVVGSGEHFEPGFEASLRREFGSHRRIHFTGLINPVSSVYSQVSCVVVPSREEAFGLVPIEAMSHCLPVIVSDVSELPQIVGHGDEGLVFRSGDVGALAEAMKRLMQDSDLRSRLAKAGREKVRANYSSGHGINRIGSILRSLVSATSETREHGRAAHFNKGGPRRDQSSVGSRKR